VNMKVATCVAVLLLALPLATEQRCAPRQLATARAAGQGEDMENGTPHPLRMEEWVVSVKLQKHILTPWRRRRHQKFAFLESGEVLFGENRKEVGRWWYGKDGLRWDVNTSRTVHRYNAQVHLNVFSERPRMLRGVVWRDRYKHSWLPPHLFRPVVGTFYGYGDSKDTHDARYLKRYFEEQEEYMYSLSGGHHGDTGWNQGGW